MIVNVPPEWVKLCKEYGREAEKYGGRLAYAGRVNKVAAQFYTSKIAEVALALFLGEDPNYAVQWVVGKFDDGYDVMDKNGIKYDVKSTINPRARYLIWGADKTKYYQSSNFDVIVFSVVNPEPCGKMGIEVDLVGFDTKQSFYENCKIASESDPIQTGSWFMDKDELKPMECLDHA